MHLIKKNGFFGIVSWGKCLKQNKLPIAYISEKQNGAWELRFAIQSQILEICELPKKPYAAGIGVHKASTRFKNGNDNLQSIFSLPLFSCTRFAKARGRHAEYRPILAR